MQTLIPTPDLARELEAYTGRQPPKYRVLYNLIIDGRLPALKVRGRWFVRRDELAQVAEMLGMIPENVAA